VDKEKGINLLNSLELKEELRNDSKDFQEQYVIQKYIANPFLINGFKHTLRLYILVTSFEPLRIYLYKNGIVKFATAEFDSDISHHKTEEIKMHVTNQALNQNSKDFKVNKKDVNATTEGSRWSIEGWSSYLRKNGLDIMRFGTR